MYVSLIVRAHVYTTHYIYLKKMKRNLLIWSRGKPSALVLRELV